MLTSRAEEIPCTCICQSIQALSSTQQAPTALRELSRYFESLSRLRLGLCSSIVPWKVVKARHCLAARSNGVPPVGNLIPQQVPGGPVQDQALTASSEKEIRAAIQDRLAEHWDLCVRVHDLLHSQAGRACAARVAKRWQLGTVSSKQRQACSVTKRITQMTG